MLLAAMCMIDVDLAALCFLNMLDMLGVNEPFVPGTETQYVLFVVAPGCGLIFGKGNAWRRWCLAIQLFLFFCTFRVLCNR